MERADQGRSKAIARPVPLLTTSLVRKAVRLPFDGTVYKLRVGGRLLINAETVHVRLSTKIS